MFYENFVEFINTTIAVNDEALRERIVEIVNSSMALLGVIFCAWFMLFIVFSMIRKNAQFSVAEKFSDVENINAMQMDASFAGTQDMQFVRFVKFRKYCAAKKVKSNNPVAQTVYKMYTDGQSTEQQAPPEKYYAIMKSKVNQMVFGKYISILFAFIVFMLIFPDYSSNNSGAIIFFALLKILCTLIFIKFLEFKLSVINEKIYSQWYKKLCKEDTKIAERIEKSEKEISLKFEKFAKENKAYAQNAKKISQTVELLNDSINSLNTAVKENSGYVYEAACEKLVSAVKEASALIESYQGFSENFENRINELSTAVEKSSTYWKNTKPMAANLVSINNNLDKIKANSNAAVADVLEAMREDVTSQVKNTTELMEKSLEKHTTDLASSFSNFQNICSNFIKAIEEEPNKEFRQKLIDNQNLLIQELSAIERKRQEFERVISVFTSNTQDIIEIATAMRKWENEPNRLKKWANYNKYRGLLEKSIDNAETYEKIKNLSEDVKAIKISISETPVISSEIE